MNKTDILEVAAGKLSPYILLFGLYLISFGHLSPGGGFQGGAVLASGVILLFLGRDSGEPRWIFTVSGLTIVEASMFFLFLVMGTTGLLLGKSFLGNFLPVGPAGELPAAGYIFLLNMIIGLKVGAGISLICLHLHLEDGEEK